MACSGHEKTPFNIIETSVDNADWLPCGIGIDVHLKFAIVAVVVPNYASGQVASHWQKVDINRNSIVKAEEWICDELLKGMEPPFNYVIESTSTYHFPFIRHFSKRMKPIVINPTLAGKDRKKTDKYDARKLANHCMTGLWKPTPMILGNQESLRVLVRTRKKLERARIVLTNRMGTRLCQYGITFSQETRVASRRGMEVIKQLADGQTNREILGEYADCDPVHFYLTEDLPEDMKIFLSLSYKDVYETDDKIDVLSARIMCLIRNGWEEDYKLLLTVPGLGKKGAEIYLAEVGNKESIARFRSAEAVVAFCGLSPEKKVSAGKMTSHLKRGGNIWIKPALIQSGQAVLRQNNLPLADWGRSIQLRSREGGYKKAVAAVARRVAAYAYHVLRTGKEFDDSKADYTAAERSAHKRLKRINREIDFIDLGGDDKEGRRMASTIACQLANRLGGVVLQYAPASDLSEKDVPLNQTGLKNRINKALCEVKIQTASQLYVAITTGALNGIKGIGEKSINECINMMLDGEFMYDIFDVKSKRET